MNKNFYDCENNKKKIIEDINEKFFYGIMAPSWYIYILTYGLENMDLIIK